MPTDYLNNSEVLLLLLVLVIGSAATLNAIVLNRLFTRIESMDLPFLLARYGFEQPYENLPHISNIVQQLGERNRRYLQPEYIYSVTIKDLLHDYNAAAALLRKLQRDEKLPHNLIVSLSYHFYGLRTALLSKSLFLRMLDKALPILRFLYRIGKRMAHLIIAPLLSLINTIDALVRAFGLLGNIVFRVAQTTTAILILLLNLIPNGRSSGLSLALSNPKSLRRFAQSKDLADAPSKNHYSQAQPSPHFA